MVNDEKVINFFQKDKQLGQMQLAISTLVKRQDSFEKTMQELLQKLTQSSQPLQNNPLTQALYPQPQNPFAQIGEFAKAMSSLRSYENTVLDGYRKLRTEIQKEIVVAEPSEYDEDNELMKMVAQAFMSKQQPAPAAEQAAPNFVPIEQMPAAVKEIKESETMKFDLEAAKKQLPEFVKNGIQDGTISFEQAKAAAMPQILKEGLPITEQDLKKLYDGVKADKPKPKAKKPKKSVKK